MMGIIIYVTSIASATESMIIHNTYKLTKTTSTRMSQLSVHVVTWYHTSQ